MQYRNLGKSGLKVSDISLGSWISFNDSSNIELPKAIINKAIECGINLFDTSDGYNAGHAEVILGEVLAEHPRDSYVISTKVFFPSGGGPNDRGLSRKHIFSQLHKSLKKLKTDYIDLYLCHWYDNQTPLEETLRAMDDLVRQGHILYYGVSNWTAAQISDGMRVIDKYRLYPIIANQPSYNMLDRYIEKETLPLCGNRGIGQIVYSPLAQGVLTGKYLPGVDYPKDSRANNPLARGAVSIFDYLKDDILITVKKLSDFASELGISLIELSLAWVLRDKRVSSALIGASNPKQIEANIKASGISLSDEALSIIENILDEGHHIIKHNIEPW